MKTLSLIILSVFALTACNDDNNNQGAVQPVCEASAGRCLNPTILKFKTANGYESASWGDVPEVTVTIYSTNNSDSDTIFGFMDEKRFTVLGNLGLFTPQENGLQPFTPTGEIKISFISKKTNLPVFRYLLIQNNDIIQDADFPEVTYKAAVKIDKAWLQSLQ